MESRADRLMPWVIMLICAVVPAISAERPSSLSTARMDVGLGELSPYLDSSGIDYGCLTRVDVIGADDSGVRVRVANGGAYDLAASSWCPVPRGGSDGRVTTSWRCAGSSCLVPASPRPERLAGVTAPGSTWLSVGTNLVAGCIASVAWALPEDAGPRRSRCSISVAISERPSDGLGVARAGVMRNSIGGNYLAVAELFSDGFESGSTAAWGRADNAAPAKLFAVTSTTNVRPACDPPPPPYPPSGSPVKPFCGSDNDRATVTSVIACSGTWSGAAGHWYVIRQSPRWLASLTGEQPISCIAGQSRTIVSQRPGWLPLASLCARSATSAQCEQIN